MKYYYKCFNKKVCVEIYNKASEMLDFWLKRFCPNITKMKVKENENIFSDLNIKIIKSKKYDYVLKNNNITIFGIMTKNESYIAKFITQCFQSLLIKENILIIPASCVSYKGKALLILGDFWQGKTAIALNISSEHYFDLVSDNYVAIKEGKVIGYTEYLSIRKENITNITNSIYNVNDRYFYKNLYSNNISLKIAGFLLPYINSSDNNIHTISDEESKWYLYQKFTRLLCGETILFEGKLPSPIFLNKNSSKMILNIIEKLLKKNKIKYVSSSMDKIKEEGKKFLSKGEAINE